MYLIYNIGGNKAEKEMTYQILMLLEMVLIFVSLIIVIVVVEGIVQCRKDVMLSRSRTFLNSSVTTIISLPPTLSLYIFIYIIAVAK